MRTIIKRKTLLLCVALMVVVTGLTIVLLYVLTPRTVDDSYFISDESKDVITLAAIIMGIAAFIGPLQAFLVSIPSAIFGGCAAVLYGYITVSGIRTIMDNHIDLIHNNKNITIVAAILTLGVSGAICDFGIVSIGTTALAMIIGVILNLVLKDKKPTEMEHIDLTETPWEE